MSNLFICSTPIQLKIATKIIEHKKLDKKKVRYNLLFLEK